MKSLVDLLLYWVLPGCGIAIVVVFTLRICWIVITTPRATAKPSVLDQLREGPMYTYTTKETKDNPPKQTMDSDVLDTCRRCHGHKTLEHSTTGIERTCPECEGHGVKYYPTFIKETESKKK